jgi:hypothetical protein
MKLQFKALSLTLGLVALLGACTSVKSGTPDVSDTDSSVEMPADGIEANSLEELEATEDIENTELEATEDIENTELEATEDIEDAQLEAAEEIEDAENAEIETPELEATEEADSIKESSSVEGTEDTVDNAESQF